MGKRVLIYGKGINDMPKGWTNKKVHPTNFKIYNTWHDMLKRCLKEDFYIKNPSYKGCTVCDRWLYLSNFVEDIQYLEGYELWLSNSMYYLDKDIKVSGNKHYCPEYCMFVSSKDSAKDVHSRNKFTFDNAHIKSSNYIKNTKGTSIICKVDNIFIAFRSANDLAKYIGTSHHTILNHLKTDNTFKGYEFYDVEVLLEQGYYKQYN